VWEIDDWESVEISMVAVPADAGAGVGRSAENPPEDGVPSLGNPAHLPQAAPAAAPQPESNRMPEAYQTPASSTPAPAAPASVGSDNSQRDAERARTTEILELGQRFGQLDAAREFIATGKSAPEFQRHLLSTLDSRGSQPLPEQGNSGHGKALGLTDKEKKRYSLLNVMRLLADPQSKEAQRAAAFELECDEAMEKQGHEKRGGVLVPQDYMTARPDGTDSRAWSAFNTATSATDTGDTGGRLVNNELMAGSFIEILRNRSFMLRRARSMMGLVGNVTIPVQTSTGQIFWIGEGANAPETSLQVAHIGMSPKTAAAYNEVTRRLLMQSTPDAEMMVMDDLSNVLAIAIDAAAIAGTGASGQPTGITTTAGIGSVTGTTIGYAGMVEFQTDVASSNALANGCAYLTTPAVAGLLKQRQRFASTDTPIWGGSVLDGLIEGYLATSSTVVPAATMIFGDFSQVIIGNWGTLELEVNPYANFAAGIIGVRAWATVDVAIRQAGAFSVATSIT
jgi:HK97 family phage major capsid protein